MIKPCTAIRSTVVLGLLSFLGGCATAPTQEMADARAAVRVATDVGAPRYAPQSLERAQRELARAKLALEAGRFDAAKNDAEIARQEAVKAARITLAVTEAQDALAQAATVKGLWTAAETALIEAQAAAKRNDETGAVEAAKRAVELAHEGENQSNLAFARRLLELCAPGGEPTADYAQLVGAANEALTNNRGTLAAAYASRACALTLLKSDFDSARNGR